MATAVYGYGMRFPAAANGPVLGGVVTAIPKDTAANTAVEIAAANPTRSKRAALSVLIVVGIEFTKQF